MASISDKINGLGFEEEWREVCRASLQNQDNIRLVFEEQKEELEKIRSKKNNQRRELRRLNKLVKYLKSAQGYYGRSGGYT